MNKKMNRVQHFELPADDMDRIKKFYRDAFGWQTEDVPEMGYTLVRTVEVDKNMVPKEPGAINGGIFERTSAVFTPTISISVPDIDSAMEEVVKAGGMVVKDKMPAGDMGFMAYFSDTEGNIIGLWQNE